MAGVQDHIVTIGAEAVAFGTKAAVLTRGIEHHFGLEPTPQYEMRRRTGMRPSAVAAPDDQLTNVARNGKIPIEVELLNKAHGLLLAAVGTGDPVVTTPDTATLTRLHTITPTTAGPTRSLSIHNEIPQSDGSVTSVNYLGCMAEQLTLSVAPKQFWKLKVDFDYATDDLGASTVTPAYPTTPRAFLDTDATITFDSVSRCARAFDVTIPTAVKTDLDRICPTGRLQPRTTAEIVGTGTVEIDYLSTALWAKWKAGTAVPLTVAIANPNANAIETGFTYSLTLTIPAVRLTGAPPDRAEADLTGQKLPFQIVWDRSNPPWKLEYQTTDTAP